MRPIDADALYQEMIKTIANMMRTRRWMRRDESNEEEILSVIQNAPTLDYAPKWISVKDRLPERFVSVLVHMPGETPHPTVHEGYMGVSDWYAGGFRREDCEVTHWMPLPEPPKEE